MTICGGPCCRENPGPFIPADKGPGLKAAALLCGIAAGAGPARLAERNERRQNLRHPLAPRTDKPGGNLLDASRHARRRDRSPSLRAGVDQLRHEAVDLL